MTPSTIVSPILAPEPVAAIIESPPELENTEPKAIDRLSALLQLLSPEQQQKVLDFTEFLLKKEGVQVPPKSIWEKIREHMAEIPEEELALLPTDGSYQHDHYLYGTPKREL
jgi:hypothetical protein